MAYCSRCGVEVEDSALSCPLCSTPIQRPTGERPGSKARLPEGSGVPVDSQMVMKGMGPFQVWMILSVPFLTASLILLTLGSLKTAFPLWDSYALASTVASWAFASCFVVVARWPVPALSAMFAVIAALLGYFDALDPGASWFAPLALPVVLAAYAYMIGLGFLFRSKAGKGPQTIGFFLIATSILCLAIDVIVSAHRSGSFLPGWSLIVNSALLPCAILFLLMHYAFKRKIRLKRYFHL